MVCDTDSPGTSIIAAPLDLIVSILLLLYTFKALGSMCDDYFVIALEAISVALNLSPDVAGATFMAAGSSAPELFTSVVATFLIVNEGGVGTIIGSAIFNILVIIGATCLFAGQSLELNWYPLTRDTIFYVVAILEMSLALLDEEVVLWEALLLIGSYVAYCVFMKFNGVIAAKLGGQAAQEIAEVTAAVDCGENGTNNDDKSNDISLVESPVPFDGGTGGLDSIPLGQLPNQMEEGCDHRRNRTSVSSVPSSRRHSHRDSVYHPPSRRVSYQFGVNKFRVKSRTVEIYHHSHGVPSQDPAEGVRGSPSPIVPLGPAQGVIALTKVDDHVDELKGWRRWARDPLLIFWEYTMPDPSHYWILFGLSILWIGALTYLMVDACNRMGCLLNLPSLVMGLVFLAAGTSVPDALGSIAVARQGEGDMAVSNAVGSNVFDIMLGLGVPWTLKLAMGKHVLFPNARDTLPQYILILALVLFLFLATVILNRWVLNKQMGASLIVMYGGYVVYALIRGGSEEA
ncbi:Sodium/potassium/calcium exchanger 4 precursor, putative [Perkinsus marinus ATCC 50983]|uniref:Sodium/potassium/calcium exchanger 4, putative n=1 Tax=Perkinsus marinus (strain ATCC 50983 / TXsc) TaxID=423536 RepID=C5KRR7_PERM5|nr:Sodium/potassium/calcium exchanger 4 precursor, putative [Perkinsus marinus ATCC 50983]EER12758.1 Sodium/potassium/calcium exchanger 4 precursor, putative [Perkinsus marinus ATCC 50983]|eukprot:XP_002780963.1 Sodium/potassium/calcium exchanger 4 precursor, putative [Perkinsus marinus ATCC 50983]